MTPRSTEPELGTSTTSVPASLNLRDVGRIPIGTGLTLATGRFYRSGNPSQLGSPGAVALARALGLRTVIDLRTTPEVRQHRPALILPSCKHLHLPLFEEALPQWIGAANQTPMATATRYLEMVHEGVAAIAAVVRAIGECGAQPFIIHCAAGRDRTGIVVACVLDLLGAEEQAIASDYALSDTAVDDGGRAHSKTIVHLFSLLREQHGSTLELLSPYGVSSDVVAKLSSSLALQGSG